MSIFNALCPRGIATVSSSTILPLQCYQAGNTIDADAQKALISYAIKPSICPLEDFPVIDGKSVNWNSYQYPFKVTLDEKTVQHTRIYANIGSIPDVSLLVDTDCNAALNGSFPGCSRTTQSGACEWKPTVLGNKVANDSLAFKSCGGEYVTESGWFHEDYICDVAASFCQRIAWDQTYKEACCRKRLQEEFGLSQSIWLKDNFWGLPNTPLGDAFNPAGFPTATTSQTYNPYQLYCDPQWCATSPSCDPVFYDLCKWSTTTNDNGVIHACLAGHGECYNWYNRSTNYPSGDIALINGVHSWLLIDNMVKDYCLNSTTVVNGSVTTTDTQSCACVGTGNTAVNKPSSIIYFTSCSEVGITCTQNVVPVVPVAAAPGEPFDTAPQVLTDVICSNLACLNARDNRTTSFLTSGIQERALACPDQVCILANLNSTFSAGDIGTGTRYIFNQGQFCYGYSFSENATTYQVVEFPTIWFYSNVGKSITNPNLTSILRIRNVSTESNNIMTWSVSYNVTLPQWIQQQGTNYGTGVLPGKEASMEWVLGEVGNKHPAYFNLPIALTLFDQNDNPTSIQSITLNFAITDIDKPFAPSPSGNDFSPNGLPLNVREVLSPGGIALIAFTALMFLLFLYLCIRSVQTRNLVSRALSKKRFDLL